MCSIGATRYASRSRYGEERDVGLAHLVSRDTDKRHSPFGLEGKAGDVLLDVRDIATVQWLAGLVVLNHPLHHNRRRWPGKAMKLDRRTCDQWNAHDVNLLRLSKAEVANAARADSGATVRLLRLLMCLASEAS
jgi:hypothetical protein